MTNASVGHRQPGDEAEGKVLNITTKRGGFADLDASRGGCPVTDVMWSS